MVKSAVTVVIKIFNRKENFGLSHKSGNARGPTSTNPNRTA